MGGIGNDGGTVSGSGAALVFTGNSTVGWTRKQKLSGDSAGDQFGWSVATNNDGTVIVMGGPFDDPNSVTSAGSALVFTGNSTIGWTQKQKLNGDSTVDLFGWSVATNDDGNVILMGGIGNDGGAIAGSGGAMIFTLTPEIIFNQNSYKYTGITGNLCFISKNYDYSYIESGKPFSYSTQKYYEGLSEIYVNGIRQSYNEDYNELSSLNLKTGVLFLEQLPDIIYNN